MATSGAGVSWEELKSGIRQAFSEDRVDVDQVKRLMSSYVSRRSDWEQYEHFDKHKYVSSQVPKPGNGRDRRCHLAVASSGEATMTLTYPPQAGDTASVPYWV